MSIKFIDDLVFDIYLRKEKISNVNFNNKDDLEKYLKKLFKVLKNKYNIIVEGFYNITVYIDRFYGVVIHMDKENLEYYDYFKNQVDMRIVAINTDFLYLVDDIPFEILKKVKVLIKNNCVYLKLKKKLSNVEMMNLMENSEMVYEI